MRGLALEGGGSRGAYHIGVVQAYLDEGYVFDGFVGTSIGAINAAVLAQGDFEKALELWSGLSTENLFPLDADERSLIKIGEAKWDMSILSDARGSLKKIISGGGVNTSGIRKIVSECVDEERLRASSKDFGLVTVSVTERKPYELFLEDIPQGELPRYIMASACFPGFKSEIIDQKRFIDGALYNNCPVNMLLEKGYDEIIAVRTMAPGIFRKVEIPNGVNIRIIVPSEDLGNIMIFSPEAARRNIRLGYLDGLRSLTNPSV